MINDLLLYITVMIFGMSGVTTVGMVIVVFKCKMQVITNNSKRDKKINSYLNSVKNY